MKATRIITAAMLALGLAALPAGAEPSGNENWHVHDGGASTIDLPKAGVVFFPELFAEEGLSYDAANDPARCPDATDKGGHLQNGQHTNRHAVNGICVTDSLVIHLRSASGGSGQAPEGWEALVWSRPSGHMTIYYRLSPRG